MWDNFKKSLLAYVWFNHLLPYIMKELDYFSANVVNSTKNSVNTVDIEDVTDIAKHHFIDAINNRLKRG